LSNGEKAEVLIIRSVCFSATGMRSRRTGQQTPKLGPRAGALAARHSPIYVFSIFVSIRRRPPKTAARVCVYLYRAARVNCCAAAACIPNYAVRVIDGDAAGHFNSLIFFPAERCPSKHTSFAAAAAPVSRQPDRALKIHQI
jgi:hypothetical protein